MGNWHLRLQILSQSKVIIGVKALILCCNAMSNFDKAIFVKARSPAMETPAKYSFFVFITQTVQLDFEEKW